MENYLESHNQMRKALRHGGSGMPTVGIRKELPRPTRSGKGVARGEAATGGHYCTGRGLYSLLLQ